MLKGANLWCSNDLYCLTNLCCRAIESLHEIDHILDTRNLRETENWNQAGGVRPTMCNIPQITNDNNTKAESNLYRKSTCVLSVSTADVAFLPQPQLETCFAEIYRETQSDSGGDCRSESL